MGGTVPAERVSIPEPGEGVGQRKTGCSGDRCWGSPWLGSSEVAFLGSLKLERGREQPRSGAAAFGRKDSYRGEDQGGEKKGGREGPFAARSLRL